MLSAIPSLAWYDDLARLLLAAGLGGAIGFERELRDREAGFRTHILVCVGAALFTIVSAYGFRGFLTSGDQVVRADPTRIAAQIVTGIGFLGAGAIIRQGLSVRGLTTAATLWVVAAIGIAAGAGYYSGAVIATALTLLALWPFRILAYRAVERLRPEEQRLLVELSPETSVAELVGAIERERAAVQTIDVQDELDRRVVTVTLDTPSQRLVAAVSDLEYVKGVHWRR